VLGSKDFRSLKGIRMSFLKISKSPSKDQSKAPSKEPHFFEAAMLVFKSARLILICLVSFMNFSQSFSAFASGLQSKENTETRIVVSVPYLADLVSQLDCDGKKRLSPVILMASSQDPHTFVLRPSHRKTLSEATIFFTVNRSFDHWVPKSLKTAVEVISNSDIGSQSSFDPHIWHSAKYTLVAAKRIAQHLTSIDSTGAETMGRCLMKFERKIQDTVAQLKEMVSQIPESDRVIATAHNAFGYLANDYGFRVESVVGLSTESAATPGQVKKTIEKLKTVGAKAVFLETGKSEALIAKIATEAGIKVGGRLYADGLGEAGSGAETTLGLWRSNMTLLVSALGSKK
jgi:zinc/manganese transport system substrate-binding protein